MLIFDLASGADPERHPVVRFRAVYFEGGPAPGFLPEWREVDRLDLFADWWGYPKEAPGLSGELYRLYQQEGAQALPPRKALGAIDGFFYRHSKRTKPKRARYWGARQRTGVTARIAFDSPGSWRELKALYRMFNKACPWCLTRYGVPQWVIEEVRL